MSKELTDRTGTKTVSRTNKCAGKSTSAGNAAGEAAVILTPFDYELDVDSHTNAKIINLVAEIILAEAKVHTSLFYVENSLMTSDITRTRSLHC